MLAISPLLPCRTLTTTFLMLTHLLFIFSLPFSFLHTHNNTISLSLFIRLLLSSSFPCCSFSSPFLVLSLLLSFTVSFIYLALYSQSISLSTTHSLSLSLSSQMLSFVALSPTLFNATLSALAISIPCSQSLNLSPSHTSITLFLCSLLICPSLVHSLSFFYSLNL